MRWVKVSEAARMFAGGLHPKTLYAAIRARKLKAARVGAGRNYLRCESFVDEWFNATALDAEKDGPHPQGTRVTTRQRPAAGDRNRAFRLPGKPHPMDRINRRPTDPQTPRPSGDLEALIDRLEARFDRLEALFNEWAQADLDGRFPYGQPANRWRRRA